MAARFKAALGPSQMRVGVDLLGEEGLFLADRNTSHCQEARFT